MSTNNVSYVCATLSQKQQIAQVAGQGSREPAALPLRPNSLSAQHYEEVVRRDAVYTWDELDEVAGARLRRLNIGRHMPHAPPGITGVAHIVGSVVYWTRDPRVPHTVYHVASPGEVPGGVHPSAWGQLVNSLLAAESERDVDEVFFDIVNRDRCIDCAVNDVPCPIDHADQRSDAWKTLFSWPCPDDDSPASEPCEHTSGLEAMAWADGPTAAALQTAASTISTALTFGGTETLTTAEVVEGVLAVASAVSNRDSPLAVSTALLSIVNKVLRLQRAAMNGQAIVAALTAGLAASTLPGPETVRALTAALLEGDVSLKGAPEWLVSALALVGKFLGLSVSASLTDSLVPASVTRWCRDARLTAGGVIALAMDGAYDLAVRAITAAKTGDVSQLWVAPEPDDMVRDAIIMASRSPLELECEGTGLRATFSRIKRLRDMTDEIAGRMQQERWGPRKTKLLDLVHRLQSKMSDLLLVVHGTNGRLPPLNFAFTGAPGLGKSLLTEIMCDAALEAIDMDTGPATRYGNNHMIPFADGYDPGRHTVWVQDELVPTENNKSHANLLGVMGEAPFAVPIAAADRIGKTYAAHLITAVTSNDECGYAFQCLHNPSALLRRAHWFKVELRDEYKTEDGTIKWHEARAAAGDVKLWRAQYRRAVIAPGSASGFVWRDIQVLETKDDFAALGRKLAEEHFRHVRTSPEAQLREQVSRAVTALANGVALPADTESNPVIAEAMGRSLPVAATSGPDTKRFVASGVYNAIMLPLMVLVSLVHFGVSIWIYSVLARCVGAVVLYPLRWAPIQVSSSVQTFVGVMFGLYAVIETVNDDDRFDWAGFPEVFIAFIMGDIRRVRHTSGPDTDRVWSPLAFAWFLLCCSWWTDGWVSRVLFWGAALSAVSLKLWNLRARSEREAYLEVLRRVRAHAEHGTWSSFGFWFVWAVAIGPGFWTACALFCASLAAAGAAWGRAVFRSMVEGTSPVVGTANASLVLDRAADLAWRHAPAEGAWVQFAMRLKGIAVALRLHLHRQRLWDGVYSRSNTVLGALVAMAVAYRAYRAWTDSRGSDPVHKGRGHPRRRVRCAAGSCSGSETDDEGPGLAVGAVAPTSGLMTRADAEGLARADPVGWWKVVAAAANSADAPKYGKRAFRAKGVPVTAAAYPAANAADAQALVRRHLATLSVTGPRGSERSCAVRVMGSFWLVNRHVAHDGATFELRAVGDDDLPGGGVKHTLRRGVNFVPNGASDLVLVHVPTTMPAGRLVGMLPAQVVVGAYDPGSRAWVCFDGAWVATTVRAAVAPYVSHDDARAFQAAGLRLGLEVPSRPGLSGSPVLVESNGRVHLVGIVSGNPHGSSGCVVDVVSAAIVGDLARELLGRSPAVVSTAFVATSAFARPVATLSGRSWIFQRPKVDRDSVVVCGAIADRVSARPKVGPSPLRHVGALKEWAWEHGATDWTTPCLKPIGYDGEEWIDPYGCSVPGQLAHSSFDPALLASVAAQQLSRLGPVPFLQPYTAQQAVFGVPGQLPAMDLTRSAGCWGGRSRGLKGDHVDAVGKTLLDSFARDVEELEASVVRGQVEIGVTFATLKMEQRKVGKDPRTIFPGSFPEFVVARRVLAPLARWYLNQGVGVTDMAVGINATDPVQWAELRDHVTRPTADGRAEDIDARKHDQNTPFDLGHAEGMYWVAIADAAGYSEADQALVYYSTAVCRWKVRVVDGVLALYCMGRHSGMYMTEVLNGQDMQFALHAAFDTLKPPDFGKSFVDSVGLALLGDDTLMGVCEEAREWYNTGTIRRVLEWHGISVTNGDKSVEAREPRPMHEVVFLQRTFVTRDDGLVAAPLDVGRVAKVCRARLGASSCVDSAYARSAVHNMAFEMHQHGREEFGKFRAACHVGTKVVFDDGSTWVVDVPSYEAIEERFVARTLRTWDSGGQFTDEDGVPSVDVYAVESTSGPDGDTTGVGGGEVEAAVAPAGPLPPAEVDAGVADDLLGRWVTINTTTITPTSGSGTASGYFLDLNPTREVLGQRAVARYAANKKYLRADAVEIMVTIAATSLHRGALRIGMLPGNSAMRGRVIRGVQVAQMTGVDVCVSGATTTLFSMPLDLLAGYIDLANSGTLYGAESGPLACFAMLAPLGHGTQTPVPPVVMTVRARLVGAQLVVPTDEYFMTVTSELSREGLVSRPATIVASAAHKLKGVPVIGRVAAVAADVATAVGSVAALFGLGRPAEVEAPMWYARSGLVDYMTGVGVERQAVASVDPKAQAKLDPGQTGLPVTDEMSLAYLGTRQQLVAGSGSALNWPSSAVAGSMLACIPVSPAALDAGVGAGAPFVPHPVMLVGHAASWWAGTMVLRVVVCSGTSDSGRIRCFYQPGTGLSLGVLDPMQKYSTLLSVDGAGTHEAVMRVPMMANSPVVPMPYSLATCPRTQYVTSSFAWSNGAVHVVVESPFLSGKAVDATSVLVYATWEDILFFDEGNPLLYNMTTTSEVTASFDAPRLEGDPAMCGHVPIVHLRALLQRYQPVVGLPCPKEASSGPNWGGFSVPVPMSGFGPDGTRAGYPFGPNSKSYPTSFDYAVQCYARFRGSVRIMVTNDSVGADSSVLWPNAQMWLAGTRAWTTSEAANTSMVKYATYRPTTSTGAGLEPHAFLAAYTPNGIISTGFVRTLSSVADKCSLRIPWSWVWPWRGTAPDDAVGLPSPGAGSSTAQAAVFCAFWNYVTNTSDRFGYFTVHQALAEDVVMARFVCCPIVASGTWPG